MIKRYALLRISVLIFISLVLGAPTLAQDGLPQLVDPSGNTVGEVSLTTPVVRFVVASNGNEAFNIQVLGIGSGFLPHIRVLNAIGAILVEIANPTSLNAIGGDVTFVTPGAYTIEVSGEQGSAGQFVLQLLPAEPSPPPVELFAGQAISAVVGSDTPVLIFRFGDNGLAGQTLSILGGSPDRGPAFSITNEATGRVITSADETLTGATFVLGNASHIYRVEVRPGSSGVDTPFTICLACGSPAFATNVLTQAVATTAPNLDPCIAASNIAGNANVRSGPATTFNAVGALRPGEAFPVMAQTQGGGWVQIEMNDRTGWVAGSVVRLEGDCSTVPVVNPATGGTNTGGTNTGAGTTGGSSTGVANAAGTTTGAANAGGGTTSGSTTGGSTTGGANAAGSTTGGTTGAANTGGGTTGGTTTGGAALTSLPDLAINVGGRGRSDGPHEILLTVVNNGPGAAGPSVATLCAPACETIAIPALAANQSAGPFNREIPDDVEMIVTFQVDSPGVLAETDETNNAFRQQYDAAPSAALPDLYVSDWGMTASADNSQWTFSALIANSGPGASGASSVTLCNTANCQTFNLGALQPGGAQTFSMTFPAQPAAITNQVMIDPNNDVAESDEGNNYAEFTLAPGGIAAGPAGP